MTKAGKLFVKFKQSEGQFKWLELISVLKSVGFTKIEGEGSRVTFVNEDVMIKLHKPHPQKEVKAYAVRQIKEILKNEGFL